MTVIGNEWQEPPQLLCCTHCNFAIHTSKCEALVTPGWVNQERAFMQDPFKVWDVHRAPGDPHETWGKRCSCHGHQFCGLRCGIRHRNAEPREVSTERVEHFRKQQSNNEEQAVVLLAAVELILGLVLRNIPAGEDASTIVRKRFVEDLVKKGWGLRPEILNAAARVSKQLEKECMRRSQQ